MVSPRGGNVSRLSIKIAGIRSRSAALFHLNEPTLSRGANNEYTSNRLSGESNCYLLYRTVFLGTFRIRAVGRRDPGATQSAGPSGAYAEAHRRRPKRSTDAVVYNHQR